MPVGSGCDGAGSFPLLAGADDDAGHSGPVVCAIVARIWVAGGSVSREPDGAGGLQPVRSRGASDLQEAELLARGKGSGGAAGGGREAGELDRARISAIAAADLRSAGAALCAGRRANSE